LDALSTGGIGRGPYRNRHKLDLHFAVQPSAESNKYDFVMAPEQTEYLSIGNHMYALDYDHVKVRGNPDFPIGKTR
jgi:hypothetical protein